MEHQKGECKPDEENEAGTLNSGNAQYSAKFT